MSGRALVTALVLLAAVTGGTGCGKPVLRIADPSLGDYYSAEEFRRLRRDQRDEYCADLARQDSMYRASLADLGEALAAIEARRAAAAAAADSLTSLADALEASLAQARAGTGASEGSRAAAAVYTVRPGDCLWRIAARSEGYGDGRLWKRIHEANRDRIRDPDLIYPGQEIRIPR